MRSAPEEEAGLPSRLLFETSPSLEQKEAAKTAEPARVLQIENSTQI